MKVFGKTFLSVIFLSYSVYLSAQEARSRYVDSLLQVYQTQIEDSNKVNTLSLLYNAYLYNDVEKAKNYAVEELDLAREIKYEPGIAQSLYDLGGYYYYIFLLDSSRKYFHQSLSLYTELRDLSGQAKANQGLAASAYANDDYELALSLFNDNIELYKGELSDSLSLGSTYRNIAEIHLKKGNYKIALTECMKSLKILESLTDPKYIADTPIYLADTQTCLATIEGNLGNYKKSTSYYQQALKIYRDNDDKHFEARTLIDIGCNYRDLKDYEKAIDYFEKSIVLSKEIKNIDQVATSLLCQGECYTAMKQFQKAVILLEKSLSTAKKMQGTSTLVQILNQLGVTYIAYNKPNDALSYLDKAIAMADSIGTKPALRDGYLNRAKSYAMLHNYQLAYEDYQKFTAINDSIFNSTKSQQIEELRTIYDTEKKEQQIVLQDKEIAILANEAKINRLQKLLLGGSLGLSLLVVGFGFYGFRQKIKRNKVEREKVDTELAFKRKELTTHTLHLVKKNDLLADLQEKLNEIRKSSAENKSELNRLVQLIKNDHVAEKDWENFKMYFEQVHQDFDVKLRNKIDDLTNNEIRLAALMKMNLTTKEIANVLNISPESVRKARYRLRKKLKLPEDDSLSDFLFAL